MTDSAKGTYALLLRSPGSRECDIGRWGRLHIRRGYYIYVGSAFGPGGVRARVGRHCREDKTLRWHIDYLRQVATPVGVWFSHDPHHLEHHWALTFSKLAGMAPIPGFGCTDCDCQTHLFHSTRKPSLEAFARLSNTQVMADTCAKLLSR